MAWRALAVLTLVVGLTGCTFDDGIPWGEVETITLTAAIEIPADRRDEAGRLKTANSYRVAIEAFTVTYAAVSLTQLDTASEGFDPSSPPAGCSLCHNGHCHCDGALVDYADLAIDGGAAEGAEVLALATDGTPASLVDTAPVRVAVEECGEASCELPRGTIAAVRLDVLGAAITMTVSDSLTGDAARITAPITITSQLNTAFSVIAPVDISVDRDGPARFRLLLEHRVAASLFDDVRWAELTSVADAIAATQAALDAALSDPNSLHLTTL